MVRTTTPDERVRFDTVLDEHHWLGHCLVGETMRYVALSADGEWLAAVGFGAASLACQPRDRLNSPSYGVGGLSQRIFDDLLAAYL